MPSRQWKHRIRDILQAIQAIQKDTQGMRFKEFEKNPSVLRSVAFSFMMIGEAANYVPAEIAGQP